MWRTLPLFTSKSSGIAGVRRILGSIEQVATRPLRSSQVEVKLRVNGKEYVQRVPQNDKNTLPYLKKGAIVDIEFKSGRGREDVVFNMSEERLVLQAAEAKEKRLRLVQDVLSHPAAVNLDVEGVAQVTTLAHNFATTSGDPVAAVRAAYQMHLGDAALEEEEVQPKTGKKQRDSVAA
eukprot:Sspe_Gene.50274::Locus_27844_Transcript_1_1_Confidence_1.000_Length_660::g.50274::m.50274